MKINDILFEFAPPSSGDSGDDGFSEETLKRLAAQWYNGDEDPRIEKALMAGGWEIGQDEGYDDEPGVFVVQSGDVNGNSYISWPAHELKQGVAEGALEEVDRRGFLKGLGAAAVAGAAGGAKAQNVNYAEAAATAVRKAQDAVGSFNSVKFGGEGSRIKNYIGQNVNRAVLAYCMDTNGYMVNEVIDYATNFAYKQADAVPPAITDRAMAVTAINVANAFMNSYDAAILQKFNEYKQSGNRAQSQQTQQPKQSSDEVDQFGNPRILKGMVELYVLAKDNNFQNVDAIKQELLQYIKITNNKDLVNDMYKGIKSGLDNVKASNPTRYNNIVSMYQESSSRRIGEFKNWTNSLSAGPEFKESVEQGVAEDLDRVRNQLSGGGYMQSQQDRAQDRERLRQRREQDREQDRERLRQRREREDQRYDAERDAASQAYIARWQHEIDALAHRLKGMDRDDDDWERTYDMMRDRINRYQSSTQRDVDPEQLAAISNIQYQPRRKKTDFVPDVAEGKRQEKEADYGPDYQDMVARVKKLAGLGPLKTVWDEKKRVYKNVPVAVQPAQQPKKEQR